MRKVLILALALALTLSVFGATGGGTVTVAASIPAHGTPTIALANLGAGLITNGTHSYKITLLDAGGETLPTSASAILTTATATNGKVNVTIPAFITGQTGANVYRTVSGNAGDYKLVNPSPILAAGVYVDNIADGSLGAAAPGSNTTTTPLSDPTTAPTVALANLGAGLCTDGAHNVKIAFVTSTGISALSAAAAGAVTTASATNGKIVVTVVASARTEVSSVNIYMTKAGGSTYYLAASGVANSNGNTTLNIADASLTTVAPTADTASEAANTEVSCTSGKHFRSLWIRNADATNRCYVTLDGTDPVTSASTGSWSIGPGVTWGPIELPYDKSGNNVDTITMRFDTTGGLVTYWYREDL